MTYEELLIERIPEAFQGHPEVERYLTVAGRLFDEYVAAIENFDTYRDYSEIEIERIRDLALDFGMSFPRSLDEQTQRMIIRDIHDIYSRVSVRDFMNWIFSIIGWTVSIEQAWLPNPDYYDSSIADIHTIERIGSKQSNFDQLEQTVDYSLFYLGESYIANNYAEGGEGNVYFRGRKFFDDEQTIDKLEIVGEDYDEKTKYRTNEKVGATPYLFITVLEQDYSVFNNNYTVEEEDEDGNIIERKYSFSERELLVVIEGILSYYILEYFRPTNIRVVILAKEKRLEDDLVINEDFTTVYDGAPLVLEDNTVIDVDDLSRLDHVISAGDKFLAGAPPHGFGSKMSLTPASTPKLIDKVLFNERSVDLKVPYNTDNSVIKQVPPFEFQPTPLTGEDEFAFYTPDREEYDFRLVYTEFKNFIYDHNRLDTLDEIYTFPYPRDNDQLLFCMDFQTSSFGLANSLDGSNNLVDNGLDPMSTEIIVRSPTTVTSPNFEPRAIEGKEYMVGKTPDGGSNFDSNYLMFSSFETDYYSAQDEQVHFTYYYNMKVYAKTHHADTGEKKVDSKAGFYEIMENPTQGDLEELSDINTLLLLPTTKLGFDFVVDVKYHKMPVWSNDPRNEDS